MVWCSFYEILCWFYARCNGTHTFQKVNQSHQSTEYLPKSLGDNQEILGKCETSHCVLFGQQWLFPWNSPMDVVFAQSFSYCWIMNTDLNWSKWGLQFFRCYSVFFFYDLLDGSLLRSWSNFLISNFLGLIFNLSIIWYIICNQTGLQCLLFNRKCIM